VNAGTRAGGPDNVRNAPPVTTANVAATKLADGVVHLGGGSHNSIAVEFKTTSQ